ncbi:uncharacterized protein LOC119458283 isoform X4 [Dermacentor silvarum]|uniref:uncharacterized protein LOC119458283 isoform X4 n=1 Tax=Dermacentor silvarum TaxID=543639 RepID=UPI0021007D28|nr:uncharacterized protein LOC119458283 isoform X4 [Dermacentor silvarum]XP_049526959.1 uncharacterized protein LOC119458283 isoform X4 [Dermacentor silvarum]XP_049526960.1 uncharacterized protein LOC119458283 isoform X4 [Dermacentor silvarum]XP_049526961.1 uncharacterized protein LOC119458283 isoform X4 [Dermacentor silvarum]XP_049526962.1 uncharacterized protein LOC119458283 isoform X4 [Dermacentor silvarum]
MNDFFNTSEPVWTYMSSERVPVECKVEVKISMSDTSVVFQSHFIVKNFRTNLTIQGKFRTMDVEKTNADKFNAISISNPGRPPYGYERLLFQTLDNKCGVFLVAIYGSRDKWYELRVRSSSLWKIHWTCAESFYRAIQRKRKRRQVFTRKCLDILHGEGNNITATASRSFPAEFTVEDNVAGSQAVHDNML